MFNHRKKIIGKSIYYIETIGILGGGGYMVKELYNNTIVGTSKYIHRYIDNAMLELDSIRCERYYTDDTRAIKF